MALETISMFGGLPKEPGKCNVNIVEEFGLIQQKKSKLNGVQRKWVETQFYNKYEKYTEDGKA